MRRIKIAFGLLVVLASPAAAAVMEVPIPELAGAGSCAITYDSLPDPFCHRVVTIHLPSVPAAIRSVSLRVHGSTTCTTVVCDLNPPSPYCPRIFAELAEPGVGHEDWLAEHQFFEAGTVAYTQPFESYSHGTWGFLLDGTATLSFTIDANPPLLLKAGPSLDCTVVGQRDATTIDSVTLLVDGDFTTAVARTSWGRLKSIYR